MSLDNRICNMECFTKNSGNSFPIAEIKPQKIAKQFSCLDNRGSAEFIFEYFNYSTIPEQSTESIFIPIWKLLVLFKTEI